MQGPQPDRGSGGKKGAALGVALGLVFGAAVLKNPGAGLALGLAIGAGIDATLIRRGRLEQRYHG
jgi:hypothetical protein